MSKPAPIRYDTGDLEVEVGGQKYRPHEGEWVEAYAGLTVGQVGLFARLQQLAGRVEALQGEPDAPAKEIALRDEVYQEALRTITPRIARWSWTDAAGEPLPQPRDDPSVMQRLSLEEMFYLVGLIQNGETPGMRKNGSGPSGSTSSSKALPRRR